MFLCLLALAIDGNQKCRGSTPPPIAGPTETIHHIIEPDDESFSATGRPTAADEHFRDNPARRSLVHLIGSEQ